MTHNTGTGLTVALTGAVLGLLCIAAAYVTLRLRARRAYRRPPVVAVTRISNGDPIPVEVLYAGIDGEEVRHWVVQMPDGVSVYEVNADYVEVPPNTSITFGPARL